MSASGGDVHPLRQRIAQSARHHRLGRIERTDRGSDSTCRANSSSAPGSNDATSSVQRTGSCQPSLLKALPDTLLAARARRLRSAQLLAELISLMHGIYQQGLQLAIPDSQLSALLARRLPLAVRPEEVQEVVSLLTHPAIADAFSEGTAGICLAMPLTSVTRTLRSLADLLDGRQGMTAAA